MKIQTYDFVRFGALDGAVEQIAAAAVMDRETGQMMFNVTIRTNGSHLGPRPADQPVNPGMQAIVDLHIGKRSILSYLTDRLDRRRGTPSENADQIYLGSPALLLQRALIRCALG